MQKEFKQYIERRVLVCFKQDASQETINQYFLGVEELRLATPELLQFSMQKFDDIQGEASLNNIIDNVIFPDVMTLWRFSDEAALEKFLNNQTHHRIAQQKFKPAVDRRIVFNSWVC